MPGFLKRRLIVPEVIQTSAMDCGPASLKCLLEGFRIPVSYGRLREACQTDVDGTSIDTMEEIANQLGLDAAQVMIPVDQVLMPEADVLPALAVVRLPNNILHFVTIWSCYGGLVQLMDPATGRRWSTRTQVLDDLYQHIAPVPSEGWREWAGSEQSIAILRLRMKNIGVPGSIVKRTLESGVSDPSWFGLAALDAGVRMVDTLVRSDALRRGAEATRTLLSVLDRVTADRASNSRIIPSAYWSVESGPAAEDGTEQVSLRGAVLLCVYGRRKTVADAEAAQLSPDLVAALAEKPKHAAYELFRLLRADGLFTPSILVSMLFAIASALVIEGLLLRGLLDLRYTLAIPEQRLAAFGLLIVFLLAVIGLQCITTAGGYRVGRRIEARLRIAFLSKIPRLGDRYFSSRPISDMAERNHSVHRLRTLPDLGRHFIQTTAELALTAAAIAWLVPSSASIAALAALSGIGLPLVLRHFIAEPDLRVRTHAGALTRFYLDALLGLIAIRTHGAELSIRREHEGRLVDWARAGVTLQRLSVRVLGLQLLVGSSLTIWLLFDALSQPNAISSALLVAYWALNIPVLGYDIAIMVQEYPIHRNTTMRLLEPLGAPEAVVPTDPDADVQVTAASPMLPSGVSIHLDNVTVRAGGHVILSGIEFDIRPGEHIAVVGASGAGKSSLIGLLLGWHQASAGEVIVDGVVLTSSELDRFRKQIAWVDPSVQLWNRSLFANLRYGAPNRVGRPIGEIIEQADLRRVLENLPDGMQTPLGEGGGLLSGGEGQRVRFGRAMLRSDARLVILDEPFRGLDRDKRRVLLGRARAFWRHATLICITHDVGETMGFNKVFVIEQGKLAEQGSPSELAARPQSRYRAILEAEQAVRDTIWSNALWRRIRIEHGSLSEVTQRESVR
ncbi:MAG: ATP-binding cassette domain-containing protein [Betaproteobacteria bacterium]